MELPPPDDWRGRKYLPWKLRMIRDPLPHADDCGPLTLEIEDPATRDMCVSAANWYGEESVAVSVVPDWPRPPLP